MTDPGLEYVHIMTDAEVAEWREREAHKAWLRFQCARQGSE